MPHRHVDVPHFLGNTPAVIGIERTVDDAGFVTGFPQLAGQTQQSQRRSQNPSGIRRQEENHLARRRHHGQYGVASPSA
jgi:hypothetical protein